MTPAKIDLPKYAYGTTWAGFRIAAFQTCAGEPLENPLVSARLEFRPAGRQSLPAATVAIACVITDAANWSIDCRDVAPALLQGLKPGDWSWQLVVEDGAGVYVSHYGILQVWVPGAVALGR